jgi:hypothetical protein
LASSPWCVPAAGEDKEHWLQLAGNWITMAQEADKREH